jgi:hypothetical protein
MHTTFWLESLMGRGHLEDLDGNERILFRGVSGKFGGKGRLN